MRDINQDGRLDVVVVPETSNNLGSSAPEIFSEIAHADSFGANYTSHVRRPTDGEKWWTGRRDYLSEVLYWYENKIIAGQTQLSTATFSVALNSAHAPNRLEWNRPWSKVAFLQLAGGEEAVATLDDAGLYDKYVIRRQMPPNATYPLTLLSSSPITGLNDEYFGVYGADLNNDGADELLADEFRCIGGYDCRARLHIFTVTASGTDNVAANLVTTITPPASYPVHTCPPWAIADFNQDGFKDLVSPTGGIPTDRLDPFNLFLSGGAGAALTYRPLRQRSPVVGHIAVRNEFKGSEKILYPLASISTGDFNKDGFPDIVRTGPAIPAMLFINDIAGLQRAVVTTTSKHKTGTQSTWTSVISGQINAGAILISTTPLSHAMDTP